MLHRALILFALGFTVLSSAVFAQNSGPQVVGGAATFQQNGGNWTITTSDRAIINWNSFGVPYGTTTQFVQPGSYSAVLNRVTGGLPSQINGNLFGNGRVYLINPNGIVIGSTGVIRTAGFTASTLDVNNAQFMSGGDLHFFGNSPASVVNLGNIDVSGGDVYLIAAKVENHGTINAPDGGVSLVAGQDVLLTSNKQIFIQTTASESLGGTGVTNTGVINATKADLLAQGNLYSMAINNSGQINATSVVEEGGRVMLKAEGGKVTNSGTITAKKVKAGGKTFGGDIEVLGDEVVILNGSRLDASGDLGGGNINIGGNFQGKGPLYNAQYTTVESGAIIKADALESGNGGNVVVWSDKNTYFGGDISAQALGLTGDGGKVETSGHEWLGFEGTVSTQSVNGAKGSLLLDPLNITIQTAGPNYDGAGGGDITAGNYGAAGTTLSNSANFPGVTSIITAGALGTLLNGTDVTLAATNNINVNASVTWTSGKTLTLSAGGNVTSTAGSNIIATGANNTDAGSLSVTATGSVTLQNITANGGTATGSNTGSNGGTISITGSTIDVGTITAQGSTGAAGGGGQAGGVGGGVTLDSTSGAITLNGNISVKGGSGNGAGDPKGNGGTILIKDPVTLAAAVTLDSTPGATGTGGTAGNITANGKVTGNFAFTATGAALDIKGIDTSGATGAAVNLTSTGNTTIGSNGIVTSGTAGNAGTLTLSYGANTLFLNGDLITSAVGGNGQAITVSKVTTTGNRTFDTSGGTGGIITLNGAISAGGDLTLTSTGTAANLALAATGSIAMGSHNLNISVRDFSFDTAVANSITSTGGGVLTITPNINDRTIRIGGADGTPTGMDIYDSVLAAIGNSWNTIRIGRKDTNAINVSNGTAIGINVIGTVSNTSNFELITGDAGIDFQAAFNIPGHTLLISTSGSVTQGGAGVITADSLTIKAANADPIYAATAGSINLSTLANKIGLIQTNVQATGLTNPFQYQGDTTAFVVGTFNAGSSNVTLTAGGAVTQSGNLTAGTLSLNGAGSYDFTTGGFTNTITTLTGNLTKNSGVILTLTNAQALEITTLTGGGGEIDIVANGTGTDTTAGLLVTGPITTNGGKLDLLGKAGFDALNGLEVTGSISTGNGVLNLTGVALSTGTVDAEGIHIFGSASITSGNGTLHLDGTGVLGGNDINLDGTVGSTTADAKLTAHNGTVSQNGGSLNAKALTVEGNVAFDLLVGLNDVQSIASGAVNIASLNFNNTRTSGFDLKALNAGGGAVTFSTAGDITQSGALTAGNLTINSSKAGVQITLNNASNAVTGTLDFSGVSSTSSLVSFTNTKNITFQDSKLSKGNLTLFANGTAGNNTIAFTDAITLKGNTTLSTSAGLIDFQSFVNGTFNLALGGSNTGDLKFGGIVGGGGAALNSLNTTGANTTLTAAATSITTVNGQTYDALTLGAGTTTFNTTNSNLAFNGGVTGATKNITVNIGAGDVTQGATITAKDLTITTARDVTLNTAGNAFSGSLAFSTARNVDILNTLDITVSTAGALNNGTLKLTAPNIHFTSGITLGGDTTLIATGIAPNNTVTFDRTLAGGSHALTITARVLTFGGDVTGLTTLDTTGATSTILTSGATSISTTGNQTYGALTLGTNTTFNTTGGDLAFNGAVTGGANNMIVNIGTGALKQSAAGDIITTGSLTIAAGSVTLNNVGNSIGGNISIDNVAGAVSLKNSVSINVVGNLNNSGTLSLETVTATDGITFANAVLLPGVTTLKTNNGPITFNDKLDGSASLTITGASALTFKGDVGSTTPLASFDAGTTKVFMAGALTSFKTSGTQVYDVVDATGVTGSLTLTGSDITFNKGFNASGKTLIVSSTGAVTTAGTGSISADSLSVTAGTLIDLKTTIANLLLAKTTTNTATLGDINIDNTGTLNVTTLRSVGQISLKSTSNITMAGPWGGAPNTINDLLIQAAVAFNISNDITATGTVVINTGGVTQTGTPTLTAANLLINESSVADVAISNVTLAVSGNIAVANARDVSLKAAVMTIGAVTDPFPTALDASGINATRDITLTHTGLLTINSPVVGKSFLETGGGNTNLAANVTVNGGAMQFDDTVTLAAATITLNSSSAGTDITLNAVNGNHALITNVGSGQVNLLNDLDIGSLDLQGTTGTASISSGVVIKTSGTQNYGVVTSVGGGTGTLIIDAGAAVGQSKGITADTLILQGPGAFSLTSLNDVNFLKSNGAVGAVNYTDTNGFEVDGLNVGANTLTLTTAGGSITQDAAVIKAGTLALTVTGAGHSVDFSTAANDITAVRGTVAGFLSLKSIQIVDVGPATGALTVGGVFTLDSIGATQSTNKLTTGGLTLKGTGNFTLDNAANSIGAPINIGLVIGDVTLFNGIATTINALNNGNLTVDTSGANAQITLSGSLVAGGNIDLNAGTGAVSLGQITGDGTKDLTVVGGSISVTGDLGQTGVALNDISLHSTGAATPLSLNNKVIGTGTVRLQSDATSGGALDLGDSDVEGTVITLISRTGVTQTNLGKIIASTSVDLQDAGAPHGNWSLLGTANDMKVLGTTGALTGSLTVVNGGGDLSIAASGLTTTSGNDISITHDGRKLTIDNAINAGGSFTSTGTGAANTVLTSTVTAGGDITINPTGGLSIVGTATLAVSNTFNINLSTVTGAGQNLILTADTGAINFDSLGAFGNSLASVAITMNNAAPVSIGGTGTGAIYAGLTTLAAAGGMTQKTLLADRIVGNLVLNPNGGTGSYVLNNQSNQIGGLSTGLLRGNVVVTTQSALTVTGVNTTNASGAVGFEGDLTINHGSTLDVTGAINLKGSFAENGISGSGAGGTVTLTGGSITTGNNADLSFNSTLQIGTGASALTVTGTGTLTLSTLEAQTAGLGDLTLTAGTSPILLTNTIGGTNPLHSLTVDGDAVLSGDIHTRNGIIEFKKNVSVSGDRTLDTVSGGAGADILFDGIVDAKTGAPADSLNLIAGTGDVTFGGAVGTTSPTLTLLKVTSADAINVNANITVGSMDVTHNGILSLINGATINAGSSFVDTAGTGDIVATGNATIQANTINISKLITLNGASGTGITLTTGASNSGSVTLGQVSGSGGGGQDLTVIGKQIFVNGNLGSTVTRLGAIQFQTDLSYVGFGLPNIRLAPGVTVAGNSIAATSYWLYTNGNTTLDAPVLNFSSLGYLTNEGGLLTLNSGLAGSINAQFIYGKTTTDPSSAGAPSSLSLTGNTITIGDIGGGGYSFVDVTVNSNSFVALPSIAATGVVTLNTRGASSASITGDELVLGNLGAGGAAFTLTTSVNTLDGLTNRDVTINNGAKDLNIDGLNVGANTLDITAGALSQSGVITTSNLVLNTGAVTLDTFANKIDAVGGIATGVVKIDATGAAGALTLHGFQAGSNDVTLKAKGITQDLLAAQYLSAGTLTLGGTGTFNLNNAANTVNTITGTIVGPLTFNDSTNLDVTALSSTNNNITIVTPGIVTTTGAGAVNAGTATLEIDATGGVVRNTADFTTDTITAGALILKNNGSGTAAFTVNLVGAGNTSLESDIAGILTIHSNHSITPGAGRVKAPTLDITATGNIGVLGAELQTSVTNFSADTLSAGQVAISNDTALTINKIHTIGGQVFVQNDASISIEGTGIVTNNANVYLRTRGIGGDHGIHINAPINAGTNAGVVVTLESAGSDAGPLLGGSYTGAGIAADMNTHVGANGVIITNELNLITYDADPSVGSPLLDNSGAGSFNLNAANTVSQLYVDNKVLTGHGIYGNILLNTTVNLSIDYVRTTEAPDPLLPTPYAGNMTILGSPAVSSNGKIFLKGQSSISGTVTLGTGTYVTPGGAIYGDLILTGDVVLTTDPNARIAMGLGTITVGKVRGDGVGLHSLAIAALNIQQTATSTDTWGGTVVSGTALNNLTLLSNGAVTFNNDVIAAGQIVLYTKGASGAGRLTANDLLIVGTDAQFNLLTSVNNVAGLVTETAALPNSFVTLSNNKDLNIGHLDFSTSNGPPEVAPPTPGGFEAPRGDYVGLVSPTITITTTGTGKLNVNNPLNAGTTNIALDTAGGITGLAGGIITANELSLLGAGNVALTLAANQVGYLSSNVAGSIDFRNAASLSLGTPATGTNQTLQVTGASNHINITTTGAGHDIALENAVISSGDVTLTSAGNLVNNTSGTGSIIAPGQLSLNGGTTGATGLTLTTSTSILTGTVTGTAGLAIDNGSAALKLKTFNYGGNAFTLKATGSVSSNGAGTDLTGTGTFTIAGHGSFGTSIAPLVTAVSTIDTSLDSSSGSLYVINAGGGLTVHALTGSYLSNLGIQAGGSVIVTDDATAMGPVNVSTTAGNITINNNTANLLNLGNLIAPIATGNVTLNMGASGGFASTATGVITAHQIDVNGTGASANLRTNSGRLQAGIGGGSLTISDTFGGPTVILGVNAATFDITNPAGILSQSGAITVNSLQLDQTGNLTALTLSNGGNRIDQVSGVVPGDFTLTSGGPKNLITNQLALTGLTVGGTFDLTFGGAGTNLVQTAVLNTPILKITGLAGSGDVNLATLPNLIDTLLTSDVRGNFYLKLGGSTDKTINGINTNTLGSIAIENTGIGNLSINGALDASNFSPTITHSVALINDLGNILEGPLGSIKADRLYASAGDFSPTGMKDVKLVDPTNTLIAHNDVNFISGRADRKFYYSDINGFDLDYFSVDVQGGTLSTGLINTNHFNGNATTVYLNAQGGATVNELNGAYIEATNLALGGDAAFKLDSYFLNGVSNIVADVNVNRASNDLELKNFYNLFVAFVDVDTSATTTAPMIGIQTGGNVLLDTNPYSTITVTQNIQAGLSGGAPTVSITGVVSISPTVQFLGASGHKITLSASPVPFNGTGLSGGVTVNLTLPTQTVNNVNTNFGNINTGSIGNLGSLNTGTFTTGSLGGGLGDTSGVGTAAKEAAQQAQESVTKTIEQTKSVLKNNEEKKEDRLESFVTGNASNIDGDFLRQALEEVRISEALLKRGDAAIDAGNQEVNRLGESDPVRRLLIALIDDVKSNEENVRSARSSLKATIDEISTGGKQLDGLGRDAIESAIFGLRHANEKLLSATYALEAALSALKKGPGKPAVTTEPELKKIVEVARDEAKRISEDEKGRRDRLGDDALMDAISGQNNQFK